MKAVLGLALFLVVVGAALGASWLAPADPLKTDFAMSLRPPGSPGHPFD
jgi:hypothetical protein